MPAMLFLVLALASVSPALAQTCKPYEALGKSTRQFDGDTYLYRAVSVPAEHREALREALSRVVYRLGAPGQIGTHDHAAGLMLLAFRLDRDHGTLRMTPPPDPLIWLRHYIQSVAELILQNRLAAADAFFPALRYVRRDGRAGELFAAPGLDVWPDPAEWRLDLSGRPLSPAEHYQYVAAGRFPIVDPAHDLARLTEKIQHPETMALTRQYARRQAAADYREWSPGQARSLILEEWLVLPDTRLFRAELMALRSESGLPDHGYGAAQQMRHRLRRLSSDELRARVQRLLDARPESLLAAYGGSARQGHHPNTSREKVVALLAAGISPNEPHRFDSPDWQGEQAASESLLGIVSELRALQSLPGSSLVDSYRADRLAKFEAALHIALLHPLTPDRIYRAARLGPPRGDAAVADFFAAFVDPGSLHEYAFQ